jgi:apolipoprotein N-acyltransferase
LGALCLVAAFPTYDLWPLIFLAQFFAVLSVRGEGFGAAFGAGWLFGVLINLLGFGWIFHTLRVFGEMSSPLAVLGVTLFAAYHGLAQAVWLGAVQILRRSTKAPAWVAVPLVYLPVERFFPALFPWQVGCPLRLAESVAQISDFTGGIGLTLLVGVTAGGLVDVAEGALEKKTGLRHRVGMCVAGGMMVGAILYGQARLGQVRALMDEAKKGGRTVRFGVVQPNIGIYEKEKRETRWSQLRTLHALSRRAMRRSAQVLVWPETAIQFPVDHSEALAEARLSDWEPSEPTVLADHVPFKQAPLIAGGLTLEEGEGKRRAYNVAFFIEPGGRIGDVAVKNVLLMFGEYLPFSDWFPWLRELFPHAGDLTPGEEPTVLKAHGLRVGMAICYEDIIAGFVRKLAQKDPYVLVNVTNDSWFGRSREPYQHLALATLRAIETRRAMVRATNTGVSAFIDPTGRVRRQTGIFEKDVLVSEVVLLRGRTFFVAWGDWLVWTCIVLLGAVVGVSVARRRWKKRGASQ